VSGESVEARLELLRRRLDAVDDQLRHQTPWRSEEGAHLRETGERLRRQIAMLTEDKRRKPWR